MKKLLMALLASVVFSAAAEQFTNAYETIAVCTYYDGVEYCDVTYNQDVFVVFNYLEYPGKILFHGAPSLEYVPSAKAVEERNAKGDVILSNDYIASRSAVEYRVQYSNDYLWFSSRWNGKSYCLVTKYWAGDKDSFRRYNKFTGISRKRIAKYAALCEEDGGME